MQTTTQEKPLLPPPSKSNGLGRILVRGIRKAAAASFTPVSAAMTLYVRTDKKRWRKVATEVPSWDERNRLIAALIPPNSSVVDLGCGARTLQARLAPGCVYQPCDVVQSAPEVLLCDFNAGLYPALTRHYDYVICSGVLEYMRDPADFLSRIREYGTLVILSYNPMRPGITRFSRLANGWVNHLTQQELESLFKSVGLESRILMCRDQNEVTWELKKAPADPPNQEEHSADLNLKCWCGEEKFTRTSHPSYTACNSCGTAAIRDTQLLTAKATDPLIKETYGEDFWNKRQLDVGLPPIEQRARLDLPERCLFWLRHILHYRLPPGRLLEVGCAHGALVKLLDLAGFEAVGMEMDDSIVRKARAWFDIEVVEGPVESMPEDTKKFDVVVMLDVLEHLPQPLDTVRAIVRLLKPDGLLVIQSPEYQKDRKGSWQNFVVPEHLFLFTRESVCKLLREVGLDHVRFETPIFPNDFFLFASAQPFSPITVEKIEAALCSSADGRIALGMLDLWTENSKRKSLPYPLRAVRQVLKHLRNSLRGGVRKPKDR